MAQQEIRPLSLRDFLATLFKRKRLITVLFLLGVIGVTAGVYLWPKTYEATAKILVKLGRENISISSLSESAQSKVMTSLQVRIEDINSEIEILRKRELIEQLIEKLGMDFLVPKGPRKWYQKLKDDIINGIKETLYYLKLVKKLTPYEQLVLGITKNLNVEQIPRSDIILVTFHWGDPEIARMAVQTLIELFLENHIDIHKTSEDFTFLQQQVNLTRDRLEDLETRLEELKLNEGIVSYMDQQRLLLQNKADLEEAKKLVETELAGARSEIEEYGKELSEESEVIKIDSQFKRNPILDPLKTKLLNLELEKAKLENKYLPDSRPIIEIKKEIEKVKAKLEIEEERVAGIVTMGVNQIYESTRKGLIQTRVRLVSLREKKDILERQLKWYDDNLKRLSFSETELNRLDRLIGIESGNYKLYRKRLEEARVSNLLDARRVVNVKVIENPVATYFPIKPKKLKIIGIGILISLVISIAMAILFDYLDHTLHTTEEVDRYIGLRVLASIPEGTRELPMPGEKT